MSTQIEQQESETDEQSDEAEIESPGDRRRAEKREREAERQAQRETEEATLDDDETVLLKVFRYDPEVEGKQEPRFDDFRVPFHKGMTVLDALIYARDEYDSSLTFRHSCRQAVCGSDAMFVNGGQKLA